MGSEDNTAAALLHILLGIGICITITVVIPLVVVAARTITHALASRDVTKRLQYGGGDS